MNHIWALERRTLFRWETAQKLEEKPLLKCAQNALQLDLRVSLKYIRMVGKYAQ